MRRARVLQALLGLTLLTAGPASAQSQVDSLGRPLSGPGTVTSQVPGQPAPKLTPEQYKQLLAKQQAAVASQHDVGLKAIIAALKETRSGEVTVMGGEGGAPLLADLKDMVARGVVLNSLLSPGAAPGLAALSTGRRVALRANTGATILLTPTALIVLGQGHQDVYHSQLIVASVRDSLTRALNAPKQPR